MRLLDNGTMSMTEINNKSDHVTLSPLRESRVLLTENRRLPQRGSQVAEQGYPGKSDHKRIPSMCGMSVAVSKTIARFQNLPGKKYTNNDR